MQLELNKYYKTRDGRKALVVDIFAGQCTVAVWGENRTIFLLIINPNGMVDGCCPHDGDLVGPWKEPVSFEGWFHVYPSGLSPNLHKESPTPSRMGENGASIALCHIRWTEGVGIEDITEGK